MNMNHYTILKSIQIGVNNFFHYNYFHEKQTILFTKFIIVLNVDLLKKNYNNDVIWWQSIKINHIGISQVITMLISTSVM